VETVVGGAAFRFAAPILVRREQRLPRIGNAEVHHHRGAAGKRGLGAPFEIVGRDRAHERKLKMRERIDAAGQHIAATGVDFLRPRRRFEIGADRDDDAIAHEDVGPPRMIVVDDSAAADEFRHVGLRRGRSLPGPSRIFVRRCNFVKAHIVARQSMLDRIACVGLTGLLAGASAQIARAQDDKPTAHQIAAIRGRAENNQDDVNEAERQCLFDLVATPCQCTPEGQPNVGMADASGSKR
jgi:hypothetical protein